jgi:hypothetical protein
MIGAGEYSKSLPATPAHGGHEGKAKAEEPKSTDRSVCATVADLKICD